MLRSLWEGSTFVVPPPRKNHPQFFHFLKIKLRLVARRWAPNSIFLDATEGLAPHRPPAQRAFCSSQGPRLGQIHHSPKLCVSSLKARPDATNGPSILRRRV